MQTLPLLLLLLPIVLAAVVMAMTRIISAYSDGAVRLLKCFSLLQVTGVLAKDCTKCHTSHVTRHTSHVTRHMSHVTRHTSHVTRHTSHVTRHTSYSEQEPS